MKSTFIHHSFLQAVLWLNRVDHQSSVSIFINELTSKEIRLLSFITFEIMPG